METCLLIITGKSFFGFIGCVCVCVCVSHTESFCSLADQYVMYVGLGPKQYEYSRYSD